VEILIFIAIFWIVPIFVGHAIGKPKRRHGGWWGALLGWLGVIAVALLPAKAPPPRLTLADLERKRGTLSKRRYEELRGELLADATHRECPHCKESMRRDASVCPHCHRESTAWVQHDGYWWFQDGDEWKWYDELAGEWKDVVPATPQNADAALPGAAAD